MENRLRIKDLEAENESLKKEIVKLKDTNRGLVGDKRELEKALRRAEANQVQDREPAHY